MGRLERRYELAIGAAVMAALLTGGCTTSLSVVKRPEASAILGAKVIALATSFDGVVIGDKELARYLTDRAARAQAGGDAPSAERLLEQWEANERTWAGIMAETLAGDLRAAGVRVTTAPRAAGPMLAVSFDWIGADPDTGVGMPGAGVRVHVTIATADAPDNPVYDLTGTSDDVRELAQEIASFVAKEVKHKRKRKTQSRRQDDFI